MASRNLPIQLTSFVGREDDLAEVERLISETRLVTLTGPGGCGKTRLAIQVANRISETFADGVRFADLASLREPELVPQLAGQSLGLQLTGEEPFLDKLLNFVRSKRLLLVLDNCEHLIQACARLAGQLLIQTPGVYILATSREPLAVAGERIYPLQGLKSPQVGGDPAQPSQPAPLPPEMMTYDAVSLFVERGRAILPGFTPTSENAGWIGEICQRLDGLPLAIELASARVKVLTVQEIAARLNDRFALLTAGNRTGIEPRHQTLRAALDWSFDLLPSVEQILLRRLAVFAAGCTLDTAEAVCSGEGISDGQVLDLLSSLVDKSFIVAETTGRAHARYRLLETIREYALEKLSQAGEMDQLYNRHLDLFLVRAEEASPKLTDAYQKLWLNWLESEHDNLRAAMEWSLASNRIEDGLRIAIALLHFWTIRGYMRESLTWYQRLLAEMNDTVSLNIRVNALVNATYIARGEGNVQAYESFGREAVQAAEASRDDGLLALALNNLGASAQAAGDFQTAFTTIERAIPLYRESGPPYYLRMAIYLAGENAVELGKYEIARERLDESLALCQKEGDFYHIANIYNALGDLARLEQNYTEAASAYENAAALARELDARNNLASITGNLGFTYLVQGRVGQAISCFRECLAIHLAQQNKPGQVECLIGFAAAAVKIGRTPDGVRLLAAAAAISGQPYASYWQANRMEFARYNDLARASLTETKYQAEQAAGQALSLQQAVAYAQNLPLSESEPAFRRSPDDLTEREREVAVWIAQGKTNSQIAQELVLSKRTVEKHAANILSKLGLTSRAQIVRWAIEKGLVQASD